MTTSHNPPALIYSPLLTWSRLNSTPVIYSPSFQQGRNIPVGQEEKRQQIRVQPVLGISYFCRSA